MTRDGDDNQCVNSCSGNEIIFCVCARAFVSQRPLSATSSSVWLPYTSIDQLLKTLNETQTNSSVSRTHFPTADRLHPHIPLPPPTFISPLPLCVRLADVPPSSRQAGRLPPPGGADHQAATGGSMKCGRSLRPRDEAMFRKML